MRSLLTDELFDKICEELAISSDNLHKILDRFDTTTHSFYKVLQSNESKTERYIQARSKYIENKLAERQVILDNALIEMQDNPKCANAIAQIAKEKCRIIEWDCMKLLPKVYGDKIDITTDNKAIDREIVIKSTQVTDHLRSNSTVSS